MAKQTTKPVDEKSVAVESSGKPKTSKSTAATIVKAPAAKRPIVKLSEKPAKASTAPSKKSTASLVMKATSPHTKRKTPANKSSDKIPDAPFTLKPAVELSPEERYRMIELAAYFIAEHHGFQGSTDEYWVAAEHEIASRLVL